MEWTTLQSSASGSCLNTRYGELRHTNGHFAISGHLALKGDFDFTTIPDGLVRNYTPGDAAVCSTAEFNIPAIEKWLHELFKQGVIWIIQEAAFFSGLSNRENYNSFFKTGKTPLVTSAVPGGTSTGKYYFEVRPTCGGIARFPYDEFQRLYRKFRDAANKLASK
jgi:hypothetical protein